MGQIPSEKENFMIKETTTTSFAIKVHVLHFQL